MDPDGRWRLRVGGAIPELLDGGVKVDLALRSAVLLAYLALAGPTSRAKLAPLLWPDSPEARARGNLRQLLLRLRRVGDLVDGDPLRLRPGVRVEAPWSADATSAAAAADGARAHFGTGIELDPDRFGTLATWFAAEQARRLAAALAEQERRWAAAAEAGAWGQALAAAQVAVAVDPMAERAYRLAMVAQLELGLPQDALATYGRCRGVLTHAFDAEPTEATREIAEQAAVLLARARGGLLEPLTTVARRARAGGWTTEGIALLQAAVASDLSPAAAGRRRVELAWLLHQVGEGEAAEVAALEALPYLEATGDAVGCSECGFVLGSVARHRGDVAAARGWWARALAETSVTVGPSERMMVHLNVAMVEDALDDPGTALGHYVAALEVARALGDRHVEATVLNNLAHAALADGRSGDARTLARAAHAVAAGLVDRLLLGCIIDGLARAEIACGDLGAGRVLAARAHLIAREDRDPALQVDTLVTLAESALRGPEPRSAARLAAEALRAGARSGYLPGLMDAAVAWAEAMGADDARAVALLAAVRADPRVRRAVAAQASGLLEAWGAAMTVAPTLESAVDDALSHADDAAARGAEGGADPTPSARRRR